MKRFRLHLMIVAMSARGFPLAYDEWYEDDYNRRVEWDSAALALNIFSCVDRPYLRLVVVGATGGVQGGA